MFLFKPLALVVATLTALPVPFLSAPVPAIAQTTQNPKAEADRVLVQGIQQYEAGRIEAALQSWQQALTLYRQAQDRKGEGDALNNLGLVLQILGQLRQSDRSSSAAFDPGARDERPFQRRAIPR